MVPVKGNCKLCGLLHKLVELRPSGEHSNILKNIFDKLNIKYAPTDKICLTCFKNAQIMEKVLRVWQRVALRQIRGKKIGDNENNANAKNNATAAAAETACKEITPPKKRGRPTKSNEATQQEEVQTTEKIVPESGRRQLRSSAAKPEDTVTSPPKTTKRIKVEKKVEFEDVEFLALDEEVPKADIITATANTVKEEPENEIEHKNSKRKAAVGAKSKKVVNLNRSKTDNDNDDDDDNNEIDAADIDVELKEKKAVVVDTDAMDAYNQLDFTKMPKVGCIRTSNAIVSFQLYDNLAAPVKENDVSNLVIVCEQCEMVFTRASQIRKHIKSVHKIVFQCEECLECYDTYAALQAHQQINIHVGVLTNDNMEKSICMFECTHCDKMFRDFYGIQRHYNEVHVLTSDRFKCTDCELTFKYKTSLDQHISSRHLNISNNKVLCSLCGKGFRNNYQLGLHTRVHTGEQPFECNLCNKRFAHRVNLVVHMRTHTGDLPFKCKLCDKGFSTSSHMKRHSLMRSCLKRTRKPRNSNATNNNDAVAANVLTEDFDEEHLDFDVTKSSGSEEVYTLNQESMINHKTSDSLLKRKIVVQTAQRKLPVLKVVTKSPPKILNIEYTPAAQKPVIHKCKYCNIGYTQAYLLEQHIRTHLTNEQKVHFQCTQCSRIFADAISLTKHKFVEHKIGSGITTTTKKTIKMNDVCEIEFLDIEPQQQQQKYETDSNADDIESTLVEFLEVDDYEV